MRIALITGIDKATSLQSKGGTEVWTATFAIEAARRGHQVDLYAAHGSISEENIELKELTDKVLPEYYEDEYFTKSPNLFLYHKERFLAGVYTRALRQVVEGQDEYDVVIDSVFHPSFSFNTQLLRKPVVAIGHFPADESLRFYVKEFGWPKNSHMIFPSMYQHKEADFIPADQKTYIPHGIDVNSAVFNEKGGGEVLWIGRIHSSQTDKGVEEAMQIASSMGVKMRVTGVIEPLPEEAEYFETRIRPLASGDIRLDIQPLDVPTNKDEVFGGSRVLLLPLHWEEPFGFVMLESMARGTPVVAYARGSVPELIEDGVTGFVVNSSESDIRGDFIIKKTGRDGLREALERISSMNEEEYATMRAACRKRVENKYSVRRMLDEYERMFANLAK